MVLSLFTSRCLSNFSIFVFILEFRVNPYCAENLVIGNEMELQKRSKSASQYYRKGEPVAEARIQQQQDQIFHQFTNIKILKPTLDEKTELEIAEEREREREIKRKQRIYSQVRI